jgi:pyrroline-5-carboxylate reductase
MKNIVLFGYGKMGSSIANGWLLKKLNFNFFVIEKESLLREKAKKNGFKAYNDIKQILNHSHLHNIDIIFLAVKPQQMTKVIKQFHILDFQKTLFISIAAGLSFSWFKNKVDENIKIVRAMPNLPASVGRGVTGYYKSDNLSINEEEHVSVLLNSFGKAVRLDSEDLIDVVTAISGSGPAYIFYLVEILSKIGKNEGLSEEAAKVLALETLIGSAKLLETSNIDPKTLRQNVTSPGGTTEAGLEILTSKKTGLFHLLNSTINNAKQRAIYLNSSN